MHIISFILSLMICLISTGSQCLDYKIVECTSQEVFIQSNQIYSIKHIVYMSINDNEDELYSSSDISSISDASSDTYISSNSSDNPIEDRLYFLMNTKHIIVGKLDNYNATAKCILCEMCENKTISSPGCYSQKYSFNSIWRGVKKISL